MRSKRGRQVSGQLKGVAYVRRVGDRRFFVNASGEVCLTGLRGKGLGRLSYNGLKVVSVRMRRLCLRHATGGLFVNAFRGKICVCSLGDRGVMHPRMRLASIGVAQVDPLGAGRLLMTARKTKMRGLGVSACRASPCVVTGCNDCGRVSKGVVGSMCMSGRRHV